MIKTERKGVQMDKFKISTIMPTYNVQGYIDEAIQSVAEQENDRIDLELIIIDDGSTDGTVEVVYQSKEAFPGEIVVIQQNNEGPGAARNKGIQMATGDFIAFLDGDDMLYPDAYLKLLQSATSNNADIVVGNVDRFNSTSNHFVSGLHRKIFDNDLSNTHIINNHSLLYDTTSWNKLFKAEFLKKYQILFPENILYEDIPFNMEAHLRSTCTNIITDKVYRWRLRDGNDKSITQSRFEFKNLEDRITAIKLFSEVVSNLNINNDAFIASKEFKELTLDFPLYMDHLKDAPEGYSAFFQKEFLTYKEQLKSNAMEDRLTSRDRIKYFLLEKGDFSLLKKFVEYQGSYLKLPTISVGNQQLFDTSHFDVDLSSLPSALFDVRNDRHPITKIQKVRFEENFIFIEGYAFHKYIDLIKKNQITITASLVDPDDNKIDIPLPVSIQKNKQATHMHGGGNQEYLFKRYHHYDWSGFVIEIDLNNTAIINANSEKWSLKFVLSTQDLESELFLSNPIKGGRARPKPKKIGNSLFSIHYNAKWQLQLVKNNIYGYISDLAVNADAIRLTFSNLSPQISNVVLTNSKTQQELRASIQTNQVEFSIDDLIERTGENSLFIDGLSDQEEKVDLHFEEDTFESTILYYGDNSLILEKTRSGKLKFSSYNYHKAQVEDLQIESNHGLSIKVMIRTSTSVKNPQLVFGNDSKGEKRKFDPSDKTDDGLTLLYTYQFKLLETDLHLFGNSSWFFRVEDIKEHHESAILALKLPNGNRFHLVKNTEFAFKRSRYQNLMLTTRLRKSYFDKGPRRKMLLQKNLYAAFRKLSQKKKYVMFEAYWGKNYSCNPKAIYEYIQEKHPDMVCIWSLNNENEQIPGNAIKVRRFSWKYYYYLARATYFYNNVNWPDQYVKRAESVEVQTLHGTFLKTMGLDVSDEVNTVKKMEGFRKRHGRWDYLISPSPFMTEIAKRVFEFDGQMLENGFPRNDVLLKHKDKSSSTETDELKKSIGIPLDKKVIMYAPTYRTKTNFDLKLDLALLQEKLGDQYIVLLRLHYFVAQSLDISEFEGFAYNVAWYSDIQDLYLITDILITDYSSVMFDFNILARPMIFFTYDLEFYRDTLRGMYIDFEQEAPGPLVKSTEDIADYILNIDEQYEGYKQRQQNFGQKFNTFECGQASERAVESVIKK